MIWRLLAALLVLLAVDAEAQQLAFPNAVGFGAYSVGGSGRNTPGVGSFTPTTVYKVNTLNCIDTDPATTTLADCVNAVGCAAPGPCPRICVFEVSGVINCTNQRPIDKGAGFPYGTNKGVNCAPTASGTGALSVVKPFLTIAGETAPAPGIYLRGTSFRIHASHVTSTHWRVAPGDQPFTGTRAPHSAAQLDGIAIIAHEHPGECGNGVTPPEVKNVILDHMSSSWSIDESLAITGVSDSSRGKIGNITLSNSLIYEPLRYSTHTDPAYNNSKDHHALATYDAFHVEGLTFFGNVFSNQLERVIKSGWGMKVELVRNVFFGWGRANSSAMAITDSENYPSSFTMIGNNWLRTQCAGRLLSGSGPHNTEPPCPALSSAWLGPLIVSTIDGGRANAGSKFYVNRNRCPSRANDTVSEWGCISTEHFPAGKHQVFAPPFPASNVVQQPVMNPDQLVAWSKTNTGARPAETRIAHEARQWTHMEAGTGATVDCVTGDVDGTCPEDYPKAVVLAGLGFTPNDFMRHAGDWPVLAANTRSLTVPSDCNTIKASGYTGCEEWIHGYKAAVEGTGSTPTTTTTTTTTTTSTTTTVSTSTTTTLFGATTTTTTTTTTTSTTTTSTTSTTSTTTSTSTTTTSTLPSSDARSFNFRKTSAYCTNDASGSTYVIQTDTYPRTRMGISNFGWENAISEARNRSTANCPTHAGTADRSNDNTGDSTFRYDLPGPGTYEIRLAFGDPLSPAGRQQFRVYDQDTLVEECDHVAGPGTGQFIDADCNLRASKAVWDSSNSALTVDFQTTTFRLKIGSRAGQGTSGTTSLVHLRITPVSFSPPTTTTTTTSTSSTSTTTSTTSTSTTTSTSSTSTTTTSTSTTRTSTTTTSTSTSTTSTSTTTTLPGQTTTTTTTTTSTTTTSTTTTSTTTTTTTTTSTSTTTTTTSTTTTTTLLPDDHPICKFCNRIRMGVRIR